jgi:histidinol-phosphate/aromatic aminotransferase/cobyric acid decarboxylase-like protein
VTEEVSAVTVSAVGNAGNATELFRGTAHSPSYAAFSRAGVTGGGDDVVDFCIPCNPYFPTPAMFEQLADKLRDILTYYPSSTEAITVELASLLGLQPQTMAMGNGSTELITWIDHLFVRESLAIPIPTFGRWTDQPMETGKRVDMFLLQESSGFALDPNAFLSFVRARGSRTAVICNPNNPDGGYLPRNAVISMLDQLSDLDLVVVDESFLDFADAEAWPSVVDEAVIRPNVIVLRSLGKNFGLHGIRFGYLVANPALAGKVRNALPKWNLNSFAEHVVFMLKEHRQEYAQSLRMISRDRQEMTWQLAALPGVTVFPSQGNFVFVKLPDGVDGSQVRDRLLAEHGVLVRECGNKLGSSSRFMRLVVRSQPDVQRLLTGLSNVLYGSAWYAAQPAPEQQTAYSVQQQPQQAQQQPQAAVVPPQEPRALYAAQPPQEQPALYAAPPAPQEPPAYAQVLQPQAQQMQQMQQMQMSQMQMQQSQFQQQPQAQFQEQRPLYAAVPPAAPQDASGLYAMQSPQSVQVPQDASALYAMQGAGAQAPSAAYAQPQAVAEPAPVYEAAAVAQTVPPVQVQEPAPSAAYAQPQARQAPQPVFDQTAVMPPQMAAAVQEPSPMEQTAVYTPEVAEVPPAFYPAQKQRGPRPALYWQDSA